MKKGLCFLAAFVLWLGTAAAEDPTKGVLPSRYDMRNDGIVTPVKLQYPQMCCWAFGAVGAAETAILSAMGKTYDEYPLDLSELHAAWFAKGLKETPDDTWEQDLKDWQIQQQKNIGGGESSAVGCLYAMGAGPAEESRIPYRGREATPEAYVVLREPEQWIENYKHFNANKIMTEEDLPEEDLELLGEEAKDLIFTEEDLQAEAEAKLKEKQALIEMGYYLLWYTGDNWTLPEKDEEGNSLRMQDSPWILKDDNRLPPLVISSDPEDEFSVRIPNEAGMNAAKEEMLNGHAVVAAYLSEPFSPAGDNPDLYTSYEHWAQYTYDRNGSNHIICIVGWDDNYPAENFTHEVHGTDGNGNRTVDAERTAKTTPPGNGAWLIKNSRGSETDAIPDGMVAPDGTTWPEHRSNYGIVNPEGLHTGYIWISYYDQSLRLPETMEVTVEEEGDRTGILQHDLMIVPFGQYYEKQDDRAVSVANVFTADRDMELTAVSSRTVHDNSRVIFRIVKLNNGAKDPEDGEEQAQFSKTFRYFGYHRTELPAPVSLKKGDRFSVITTSSYLRDDGKRIWQYSAGTKTEEVSRTAVDPGKSFVKENGTWQDWSETEKAPETDPKLNESYDDIFTVYDYFCIKAFYREK